MKITNHQNLPFEVVKEAGWNNRPGVDFGKRHVRVTTLIRPPQMSILEAQHWDELERDASSYVAAMMGTGFHLLMERSATTELCYRELSLSMGRESWTITGTLDKLNWEGVLTDWKTCKKYKVESHDFTDWEAQLNVYAWLAYTNGLTVSELQVWAYLKDAMASEPTLVRIPIPLWPQERVEAFITVCLTGLSLGRECTDEERWVRGGKWATMVQGKKRAVKLHDTIEDAQAHADRLGGWVEKRKKEYKRCQDFCSVSQFCPQFKADAGSEVA